MATIGVLSDTHLPKKGPQLPGIVLDKLQGVDLILHAGDLTTVSVLQSLTQIAPVQAVAGNVDPPELAAQLGWTRIVNVAGNRIGLTHGHLGHGKSTPERAWNTFAGQRTDIIIFGHSHISHEEWRDGVLLLNPGSPTDKRRQPNFSFCLLHISQQIEIEWVFFV
ncbi:metallophosphoesterase family protein [Effusibacillus dendaii]|uniref:Phosphoesterase n=1 Tax=Effusibacillus dendaii TaxID=2743772 RepID=A0A7I8D9W8_9BACL|nr:metallophosphoesterase [Effusibacillus dendaii]BCJ86958.1 phosphoesterase [Effusibacillus dendaii]